MKLLTGAIVDLFTKTGSQEKIQDPIVIARFFNPTGAGTWLATEYDPEERTFFGWARITDGEWGYFPLEELESYKGPLGLGIERDINFTPCPFSKARML